MRVVALLLLLAACGQEADAPVQRHDGALRFKAPYSAAECRSLATPDAMLKRCYGGNLETGQYVGDQQCWPFSEPRRLRGLWVIGLEVSVFYPNVNALRDARGYVAFHEEQFVAYHYRPRFKHEWLWWLGSVKLVSNPESISEAIAYLADFVASLK